MVKFHKCLALYNCVCPWLPWMVFAQCVYIINMCTFIIGISGILVLAFYCRQHAQQRTTWRCRFWCFDSCISRELRRFMVLISEGSAVQQFNSSTNRARTPRRTSETKLSFKIDNWLGFYLCAARPGSPGHFSN